MLFSPIVDAPQEHYFFVVRSSQDHQYSFIRTPRINVPEAALRGYIYNGTGIIKSANLNLQKLHRETVQRRVDSVFNRTRQAIQSLTVTLSDINGPKGGPDKQVKVKLKSDNMPLIVVIDKKSNWIAAVNSALSRVNNSFVRKLKRKKQFSYRTGLLAPQPAMVMEEQAV